MSGELDARERDELRAALDVALRIGERLQGRVDAALALLADELDDVLDDEHAGKLERVLRGT